MNLRNTASVIRPDDRLASNGVNLCICIATYKRPLGLARLLRGIDELCFAESMVPSIVVIVVDNDPARTAERPFAELSVTLRWPAIYVSEPRRGIPFARNAGVRTALATHAELIAFIDDDEVPASNWLEALLLAMTAHNAAVVTGPVLPRFELPVADWILKGQFFERPRHVTGTRLDRAATNNVLMRAKVFEQLGRGFDETLGLIGSDDTEFFLAVAQAQHPIVWVDEAVVYEWHPASRVSAGWLLRRAYRVGNGWAAFNPALRQPSFRRAIRGLLKGVLLFPPALVQGRHAMIKSLSLMATGMGYLMGKAGLRFNEYRETHGA